MRVTQRDFCVRLQSLHIPQNLPYFASLGKQDVLSSSKCLFLQVTPPRVTQVFARSSYQSPLTPKYCHASF